MAEYCIDFHVHTRVSPDGLDDPRDVVAAARDHGLDAIAITDHDRSAAYRALVDHGIADPSGRAVDGFLVIPGVEVSTLDGHILVIGATFDTPARAHGFSADETVRTARRLGALAAAAHPFDRTRSGVGAAVLTAVGFDAVEVFNSKSLDRSSNARAGEWAARHALPGIAGSDAHAADIVGRAHTSVEADELSVASVLSAVRAGRTAVVRGLHTQGEILSYLARGWFTRPWIRERLRRVAVQTLASPRGRASAAIDLLATDPDLPGGAPAASAVAV